MSSTRRANSRAKLVLRVDSGRQRHARCPPIRQSLPNAHGSGWPDRAAWASHAPRSA
jgi:hypothetical protein